MALTGVQIFKLLPKTNCKKCGFPTCLAFAMKLAQGGVELSACPDVSEEAKNTLGAASAPPIRSFALGTGEKAVKIGGETVLFRHEKKFINPCAIAVNIKDNDDNIAATAEKVAGSEIDRVGQKLRVDAVSIECASNDSAKYGEAVKLVAEKAPEAALILNCKDAAAAEAAVKAVAGRKPLLYCATGENAEAMAGIAKAGGVPLAVCAEGPEALSALTEKIKGLGVEDIVLDSGAKNAKDIIENNTQIRRAALKKSFKPLGYPIINYVLRDDPVFEASIASVAIARYASIVVVSTIEKWKNLALFTLRQNIYTDPQVPMQVEQKVYKIGEPVTGSPLMITTNFSLTYFIVSGEVENSKVPSWLAVMDCEGLSVLTAWAAGKFTAAKISQFIKESGIEDSVSSRELIIPGQVAILSGALEDKLDGWKITVGPREANAIPTFLKSRVN
ncbi:corrinoid/iron-sulfur protein large subunit [bacterium BMS3Abin10]|nr:corrinoid/iron-sulfur protein large subunit [bacterium BMS3Abin10]GBE39092.1 corrinoid/iron-sulfur protein large subunit [bacterium BMS3Bbin08]HDH50173.1 acetyl-CoA decarbonylase/synthase complex subunit gamma [Nitrospirota bacterium]HDK41669.1 acetyl-CoA decarbonylase/synthase complex subunit gamma [Nitrospirota bacterium]